LHVVWSQDADSTRGIASAIYYQCLSGGTWSSAVDVVAGDSNSALALDGLVPTASGRLALFWHDSGWLGEEHMAQADCEMPASAHAWQIHDLGIFGVREASVARDYRGTIWLAYTDYQALFCTSSTDGGINWSFPVPVAFTSAAGNVLGEPAVASDGEGRVCVAWSEQTKTWGRDWDFVGVFCAWSLDGGKTWSAPSRMADSGYAKPSLWFDPTTHDLHLSWIGTIKGGGGRFDTWTQDSGKHWLPPLAVAPPSISGHTEPVRLLRDGAGTLQAFYSGGGPKGGGIWHGTWDGANWSSPEWVSRGYGGAAEVFAVALDATGRLHVVWSNDWTNGYELWYAYADTGAPVALSQNESLPRSLPSPEGQRPTATSVPQRSASPLPNPEGEFDLPQSASPGTSVLGLLLASAASVGLVCLVLGYRLWGRRH